VIEKKFPVLGIVVPCYNEEEVLPSSAAKLLEVMSALIRDGKADGKSFVVFVDDGSRDKTWEIISGFSAENRHFRGLKLARNSGHQNALLAGLFEFQEEADCLISIDADLQDDVSAIPEMMDCFAKGHEVVYGVRRKRKNDTILKRFTALAYYKLMKKMGVEVVYNHADFRLTGKRVISELKNYEEVNLFLRGIFPLIGFRSTEVYYDRLAREAGTTKYTLGKMLAFAWDGITSFSIRPLRFVTALGFLIFFISLLLEAYAFASYIWLNIEKGWASTVVPIYMLGGLQLLCIGIIGEYLGKIYKEVKRRPRYSVEKRTSGDQVDS